MVHLHPKRFWVQRIIGFDEYKIHVDVDLEHRTKRQRAQRNGLRLRAYFHSKWKLYMPEKSCFFFTFVPPVFWFHSFASCSRLHNVQHSSFSSSFHKISLMSSSYSICVIALSSRYTRLSINLFFRPIRTFRYLSSFTYQLLILTYGCVFIFDSNLFSTSLLSQFQHSSFYFYFPESSLWCLTFFCLPLPLSRILLSSLPSLQLVVRFLNFLFHRRFIFCYIRRFHIYYSSIFFLLLKCFLFITY